MVSYLTRDFIKYLNLQGEIVDVTNATYNILFNNKIGTFSRKCLAKNEDSSDDNIHKDLFTSSRVLKSGLLMMIMTMQIIYHFVSFFIVYY